MSAHPRRRRGRGEWITGLVGLGNWIFAALTVFAWLVAIPYLLLVIEP